MDAPVVCLAGESCGMVNLQPCCRESFLFLWRDQPACRDDDRLCCIDGGKKGDVGEVDFSVGTSEQRFERGNAMSQANAGKMIRPHGSESLRQASDQQSQSGCTQSRQGNAIGRVRGSDTTEFLRFCRAGNEEGAGKCVFVLGEAMEAFEEPMDGAVLEGSPSPERDGHEGGRQKGSRCDGEDDYGSDDGIPIVFSSDDSGAGFADLIEVTSDEQGTAGRKKEGRSNWQKDGRKHLKKVQGIAGSRRRQEAGERAAGGDRYFQRCDEGFSIQRFGISPDREFSLGGIDAMSGHAVE